MEDNTQPSTSYPSQYKDVESPCPGKETDANFSSHVKSYGITIDASRIRHVPAEQQSSVLQSLGVDIFSQEEFEEGVIQQVDEAILAKEVETAKKKWEKQIKTVQDDIRIAEEDLKHIERILGATLNQHIDGYESRRRMLSVMKQQDNRLSQLKKLRATEASLLKKMQGLCEESDVKHESAQETDNDFSKPENEEEFGKDFLFNSSKQKETEAERLIRTGEMTPFGSIACSSQRQQSTDVENTDRVDEEVTEVPKVKYRDSIDSKLSETVVNDDDDDDEYVPEDESSENEVDESKKVDKPGPSKKTSGRKKRLNVKYTDSSKKTSPTKKKDKFKFKRVDDGDDNVYRERLRASHAKKKLIERGLSKEALAVLEDFEDINDDDDDEPDTEFERGFKVPGKVWKKLYRYQQTGVRWLWELHCQQTGGIVGDEMGLGKTIQMIAFLGSLKHSKIGSRKARAGLGPVLIICPATVLHQWVSEFHIWWPDFRVAVLHETGSYTGPRERLIHKICNEPGVLVTSYSGVRLYQDALLPQKWDYVILDEGHKIRNPDAEITLACKQFRTLHRLILSGSPMQNNLRELWSLFDFVFPGKLGTLPVFMTEFSVPITIGGYANATEVQVQTAYKCACVLRDTINPYLLRRMKKDVKANLDLPNKNEQVLFCRLTTEQVELYKKYLGSREVESILAGNMKVFPGLIMLRKICNHPDLSTTAGSLLKANFQDGPGTSSQTPDDSVDELSGPSKGEYGYWRRSGKMIVIEALLKMWKSQGHRVLLFSQTRQMLNILQKFVESEGYNYRRLDGTTPIGTRQPLIEKFNEDTSIFVFILTTRVGGLGVNLVGANRIVIFDPDWNPSTDMQARERAWRIGQTKHVTIYRLLTTGTIEEKIYHRQIFKQFLTNRVLQDPKQRRFFKSNDLFELFTFDDSTWRKAGTETSAIFAGTGCEVNMPHSRKRKNGDKESQHKQTKLTKISNHNAKIKSKSSSSLQRKRHDLGKSSHKHGRDKHKRKDVFEVNSDDEEDFKDDKKPTVDSSVTDCCGETTYDKSKSKEDIKPEGNELVAVDHGEKSTGCHVHIVDLVAEQLKDGTGKTGLEIEVLQNVEIKQECNKDTNIDNVNSTRLNTDHPDQYNIAKVNAMNKEPRTLQHGEMCEESNTESRSTHGDSSSKEHSEPRDGTNNRVGSDNGERDDTGQADGDLLQLKNTSPNHSGPKHRDTLSNHKKINHSSTMGRTATSRKNNEDSKKRRKLEKIRQHRKEKRRRNKIEGQRIDQVSYHEDFHYQKNDNILNQEACPTGQDDVVLKALFKKSGVHTALKHDVIENSGNHDAVLVEKEAARVAQQASNALRRSRAHCLSSGLGVPTWTGSRGTAGGPQEKRPRFGQKKATGSVKISLDKSKGESEEKTEQESHFNGINSDDLGAASSSHLLAKIRKRNMFSKNSEEADGMDECSHPEKQQLISQIRDFIAYQGHHNGKASTQEILEEFGPRLSATDNAVFKSMLRQICEFTRDVHGGGIWQLKEEFK